MSFDFNKFCEKFEREDIEDKWIYLEKYGFCVLNPDFVPTKEASCLSVPAPEQFVEEKISVIDSLVGPVPANELIDKPPQVIDLASDSSPEVIDLTISKPAVPSIARLHRPLGDLSHVCIHCANIGIHTVIEGKDRESHLEMAHVESYRSAMKRPITRRYHKDFQIVHACPKCAKQFDNARSLNIHRKKCCA